MKFQRRQIEAIIPNIDERGKKLLLKLLDYNIAARITASDALLDDYFSQDGNSSKKENNLLDTASGMSLSDSTNTFQPKILKRKRFSQLNQMPQQPRQTENDKEMDTQ